MKAELIERHEVYLRCPRCGDENSHRVTNLPVGARFGISYCENCGVGIKGYKSNDGVEIRIADEGKDVSYILLRVHPEETPQILLVRPAGETHRGYFDLRQIVSVRYDGKAETLRSIKYVVQSSSKETGNTEE